MYSDTKSCEDYRSEGVTRHMSTQGMLERLVNSIIEGLCKKSCKTICSRGYLFQYLSNIHSYKRNKRKKI